MADAEEKISPSDGMMMIHLNCLRKEELLSGSDDLFLSTALKRSLPVLSFPS